MHALNFLYQRSAWLKCEYNLTPRCLVDIFYNLSYFIRANFHILYIYTYLGNDDLTFTYIQYIHKQYRGSSIQCLDVLVGVNHFK